jgi:hypothetical protein
VIVSRAAPSAFEGLMLANDDASAIAASREKATR